MSEQYSYRVRSMQRRMKRRKKILTAVVIIAAVVIVLISTALILKLTKKSGTDNNGTGENMQMADDHTGEGSIDEGVYVETMSVGGMDYETAVKNVSDYIESVLAKEINIDINGAAITVSLDSLGVYCDGGKVVDDAFALEDSGVVNLDFLVDDSKFAAVFADDEEKFTKRAVNASLKRENGEFVIIKGKKGREIDIDATKTEIMAVVASGAVSMDELSAAAVIKDVDPEFTSEDMKKCTDVIGKFSTSFHESQASRSANVRNAVGFIDGTVLYPGDILSVADTIYPLTADNGYNEAPSYAGGQVVDSLGGGVCQVSTTLYNAVLLAELEVVQRAPHSMVVTYVKPSMDAAIAGDYKDFKFKNSNESPVYIQGSATGGILTFTIYGQETRPANRKIEYVSDVVETIEPGEDVVTKDKTLPEDYEKVTQEAHVGYIANLYKVVYEDGVEISREKINYSQYKAEPRYVTVGTKKEKDKDKDKKNKKNKNKDKNKDDSEDDEENDNTVQEPDSSSDNPDEAVDPGEDTVPDSPEVPDVAPPVQDVPVVPGV